MKLLFYLSLIPNALTVTSKISSILQLTRSHNIPSVVALSVAGGMIMNPISALSSKDVWISAIESSLIMSNSMILNDIYDISVDRINSPERPLITGAISQKEAIGYSTFLTLMIELVNNLYVQSHFRWIIHTSLLFIHLYTPVLKKIPFIKNMSCASLVAFSLIFSGISASPIPFFENANKGVLFIATNAIFGGSWVNEIILDIRDEAGDRNQGIHTIATLYGKQTAWTIAYFVSYINTMMNIVGLLFVGIHPRFYIGIMIPQIYKLYFINKSMFSRESILSHLKYTNQTMVALLLFFMFQTI